MILPPRMVLSLKKAFKNPWYSSQFWETFTLFMQKAVIASWSLWMTLTGCCIFMICPPASVLSSPPSLPPTKDWTSTGPSPPNNPPFTLLFPKMNLTKCFWTSSCRTKYCHSLFIGPRPRPVGLKIVYNQTSSTSQENNWKSKTRSFQVYPQ